MVNEYTTIVVLALVILVLILAMVSERKRYYRREEKMLNRIMAKNLNEYVQASKSHKELVTEMELENDLVEKTSNPVRGLHVG